MFNRVYKLFAVGAIMAVPTVAQNPSALAALLQVLQSAGLNQLAQVAASINGTQTGQRILNTLSSGEALTVFAPNDNAFSGVPSNISGNPQVLADVLSYHVVPGTFPNVTTTVFPNTTIGRTLFNSTDLSFLEGNRSQVLVWTNTSSGHTQILNQNTPVSVLSTATVNKTTIHVIDSVIDIPGPLDSLLDANGLSGLSTILQATGLFPALNFTHGITLFAPTNDALAKVQNQLQGLAANPTALRNIVLNHVINGTSVYSSQLRDSSSQPVSAAGEKFFTSTNSSGLFVASGNSTSSATSVAKVTNPDQILWNGVVHIIDTVLLDEQSNEGAASSAFQSATSAAHAAATSTESGPVGGLPSSTSPSGRSSSGAIGFTNTMKSQLALTAAGLLAGVFLTF